MLLLALQVEILQRSVRRLGPHALKNMTPICLITRNG
jgi:hypothetical protein